MGWANCGDDSQGRPIGYAHKAVCDYEGCAEEIDRGLSYACGGMHGSDENYCEKYFCEGHLFLAIKDDEEETTFEDGYLCDSCKNSYESH